MSTKVVLYYADFCGHCKHFKPEWERLKQMQMNDSSIIFEEYEDSKNPQIMEENQIAGFPTIHIIHDGKKTEYLGPRKAEDILEAAKNPKLQTGGSRSQHGFTKRKALSDRPIYYMMKYYKYKAKYIDLLEQNGGSYRAKVKTNPNPNYQDKYHKYKAKYTQYIKTNKK